MSREKPILPITSDWKGTFKRWAAELRNKAYLEAADATAYTDWSPSALTSFTSALGAGALVFAKVKVQGARYWAPLGGDICWVSAEIGFDISSGTEAFVGIPLPVLPAAEAVGQYMFAYTLWGTATAQRRVVPATITNDVMLVPRQENSAVNQWATQTSNYIIFSGHYRISGV